MLQPQKMPVRGNANPAVIPANAGIHSFSLRAWKRARGPFGQWIPAFAGMTRAT